MRVWLMRSAVVLVLLVASVYPLDWAVWHLRGEPTDAVEVFQMTAVPLKGGKQAFYPDGSSMVPCSRSLLPEAQASSCWWLRQHRDAVVQP